MSSPLRINCYEGEDDEETDADQLPPGFKFLPTDVELIDQFLHNKILGHNYPWMQIIEDIDLSSYHPKGLTEKYASNAKEGCWYFFTPRKRKYGNGMRPSRAAKGGFWKATGQRIKIEIKGKDLLGQKDALKFWEGKRESLKPTCWLMQEYTIKKFSRKAEEKTDILDDYVLIKIYCSDRGNAESNEFNDDDISNNATNAMACNRPTTTRQKRLPSSSAGTPSSSNSIQQQQPQQRPQHFPYIQPYASYTAQAPNSGLNYTAQAPNSRLNYAVQAPNSTSAACCSSSQQQQQFVPLVSQPQNWNYGSYSYPQNMDPQLLQMFGDLQRRLPPPPLDSYYSYSSHLEAPDALLPLRELPLQQLANNIDHEQAAPMQQASTSCGTMMPTQIHPQYGPAQPMLGEPASYCNNVMSQDQYHFQPTLGEPGSYRDNMMGQDQYQFQPRGFPQCRDVAPPTHMIPTLTFQPSFHGSETSRSQCRDIAPLACMISTPRFQPSTHGNEISRPQCRDVAPSTCMIPTQRFQPSSHGNETSQPQ